MSEQTSSILASEVRKQIDQWLKKYPHDRKQSATLIALRLVQENNGGWLTDQLIEAVADYLGIPQIAAFEVATFYSMYDLKPVGKNIISVCNNISCHLKGSGQILKHLEQRCGVPLGETTPDGCFTVKEVECLAACVGAPVMQVNYDKYYEDLTIEKVDAILAELAAESAKSGASDVIK